MKSRILVLTSSTGSGHDMRAKAFADWITALYPDRFEVRIDQVIENGSTLGRFGVWCYNTIHRYSPFLHNLYFFIVELFVFTHSGRVSFGGTYYRERLRAFRPDIVFSVHDSTNRGYFEDARRLLGPATRCVTYCGEFSGGYGYSRNWVNPAADLFIARTKAACDYAVQLGMPRERTAVFHTFLPPEAFAERAAPAERAAERRQLGLDPDRFTLFLATGGFGANHHIAFLDALLPLAPDLQLIIVCGRNQRIHDRVHQWLGRNPSVKAFVEGYSNRMSDLLQLADAVITRGGANTTMEALHFNCPILYDSLGGLMPQERCTVRYCLDHNAARLLRRPADLHRILCDWCRFGPDYRQIRLSLAALKVDEDPRALIDLILGQSRPPAGS
jgi:processive 1,2-diacylglycerol beta-glucosyltransferase